MAISKENREIREREDLLFHDSPDFIEMTERIKWFSSLNSFNEKALAGERSRRLIFDEETRQVYIDNKRLIEKRQMKSILLVLRNISMVQKTDADEKKYTEVTGKDCTA